MSDLLPDGVSVPTGPLDVAPRPLEPMTPDRRYRLLAAEAGGEVDPLQWRAGGGLGLYDVLLLAKLSADLSDPEVLALAGLLRRLLLAGQPADGAGAAAGAVYARIAEYLEADPHGGAIASGTLGNRAGWVVSVEIGREAEDSPMAGGAAYGQAPELVEALRQCAEQMGIGGEQR